MGTPAPAAGAVGGSAAASADQPRPPGIAPTAPSIEHPVPAGLWDPGWGTKLHPEHHWVGLGSVPPPQPFSSNEVAPEGTFGGCLLLWAPYPNFSLRCGAGAPASAGSQRGAVPSITILPAAVVAALGLQ